MPAVLWNRSYQDLVAKSSNAVPLIIALERSEGDVSTFTTTVFPEGEHTNFTERYVERLIKFLLWQKGGRTIILGSGSASLAKSLRRSYGANGPRFFDWEIVGGRLFLQNLKIEVCAIEDPPSSSTAASPLGRHLQGHRIGFDLGGSDRKAAAVIDGEVVFSEEIPWDPYFESDPSYHFNGICDSLRRAAAHLPQVDAIGGSAAGVYVDNEVRAGSLFRGVNEADFEQHVRQIFHRVMASEGWAEVPWQVVNDGEVTALAGSMSLQANAVLGISMGTSLAAGYVDPQGNIMPWLNELAFAPIDYQTDAPVDEWSGDAGCGVQYFSQQGVARLAKTAALDFAEDMPFPEQLVAVQELMETGDERTLHIYQTLGTCFGYAMAHYHDFYDYEHLLILGRVTSGSGGEEILHQADVVLRKEFPELADKISMHTPNEKDKRHGQAVAAASLPSLR